MAGLFASASGLRRAFAEEEAAEAVEEEETPAASARSASLDFTSDLPHDLGVAEYLAVIIKTRPGVYQTLAQLIQNKEYEKLALQPSQAPFTDLRAAAMYLAWALVRGGGGLLAWTLVSGGGPCSHGRW